MKNENIRPKWENEPDEKSFEYKGFKCYIRRISFTGHLNGYINIPEGHPWYEKRYDKIDCSCHGHITYSEKNNKIWNPPFHVDWLIGFDCAHWDDLQPFIAEEIDDSSVTYKTIEFVENECKKIVDQAIEVMKNKEKE